MALKRAGKYIFFLSFSVMIWTALLPLAQKEVFAYFEDQESNLNEFKGGLLDFSLQKTPFSPNPTCDSSLAQITITNHGNPFEYKFFVSAFSGALCDYLFLQANFATSTCQGNLRNFNCQNLLFLEENSLAQVWQIEANLLQGAPDNSSCTFKFSFLGHQIGLQTGGFHDEEEIIFELETKDCGPKILINKVYYDPDPDHGQEIDNEWIELYNPTDSPVNLEGWQIVDNFSQDLLPQVNIPPHGFALITGKASTWDYWPNIPQNVVKIVLSDGQIGNGLENDGDRILLKNPSGTISDALSYEQDRSIFDPAPPLTGTTTYDLPEGHILARDPTGHDTNTPQDWHDFALPQVSVLYPSGGTWYCRQRVTLRWQASNPNGPDSALLITLQYIRDLDGNGIVSQGDAITTIAQNISNTGSYSWQVSPCHYGYVWIRVIAQDPENFIIQNSALSERVFEPSENSNSENLQEKDVISNEESSQDSFSEPKDFSSQNDENVTNVTNSSQNLSPPL